jgi:hypothetical protein
MPRVDAYDHRPGDHCGSTSLRNLADLYGWGFDEPTAFGLASGLGFTYYELPDSPHRAFFGRPLFLEAAFFDHCGIGSEHRAAPDWETVWATIRKQIDDGRPVLCFGDIYYLDYYGSDTHFAPHSFLAVGYEDGVGDANGTGDGTGSATADGATVLLSDSEFPEPQRLPADRLRAAMTSDWMLPRPLRHLVVTDPEPDRTFAAAAEAAIRETAAYVRDPASVDRELGPGEHGLAGIRALAEDLPSWTDLPDPGWTVRFAYQNVERRGTGGGCFRRLYADFLGAASEAVPALPADAGERMHDVADDWTAAGETLQEASERDPAEMGPLLEDAAAAIHDLADREERLFDDLAAALD